MKNLKLLKTSILFFVVIAVIACNDEPKDEKQTVDLTGEWRRSDFNDEFDYRLTFHADNSGIKIQREGNDTQGISSAVTFEWATDQNILTLNFNGEIETTQYSINEDGHLLLSDISDFYFTRIK
ncbi:hypothetical protein K8089_11065 [Aequorivita sp. F47161]|uniref:Lipocalin-like domain-containing protein n=1 Tax=Aequorivita vitellina TaxID=2874475 RepID=A0A9X1QZR7_9FLAO|nr:hypothetical protein [Aequorivita vitellina]MCG2419564.1 hypothetical protein [Aequorivita vitellina]